MSILTLFRRRAPHSIESLGAEANDLLHAALEAHERAIDVGRAEVGLRSGAITDLEVRKTVHLARRNVVANAITVLEGRAAAIDKLAS